MLAHSSTLPQSHTLSQTLSYTLSHAASQFSGFQRAALGSDAKTSASSARRGKWTKAPRILIIEDEAAISTLLEYNLKKADYECMVAADGEAALIELEEQRPDLILLDWMLPYVSGIELCRRIRSDRNLRDIPIIMLTAKGEEADIVRGLEAGADDYMIKPFRNAELLARVDAALRRMRLSHSSHMLEVNDINLDTKALTVERAGQRIHLGPTEFRLLQTLMEAPGRVFSRDILLTNVWGMDTDVEPRTVDVHVRRLRKALNSNDLPDYVRTVRGVGYSIEFEKGL